MDDELCEDRIDCGILFSIFNVPRGGDWMVKGIVEETEVVIILEGKPEDVTTVVGAVERAVRCESDGEAHAGRS